MDPGKCIDAMTGALVAFVAAQLIGVPPCEAQNDSAAGGAQADVARVRAVTLAALDSSRMLQLVASVRRQLPLPGFPRDPFRAEPVTVTLVADVRPGFDAGAFAAQRFITLPATAVDWSAERLKRVVRHELAHVALGVFFDLAVLPAWFREGFAEWVAGGLDCAAEARIRLDLVLRRRRAEAAPSLSDPMLGANARIAYDYAGTFFTFVEGVQPGVVSSGALLVAIKDHGIDQGFKNAVGKSLAHLEREWQRSLLDRYGYVPPNFACVDPNT